jgi:hypothetical protein
MRKSHSQNTYETLGFLVFDIPLGFFCSMVSTILLCMVPYHTTTCICILSPHIHTQDHKTVLARPRLACTTVVPSALFLSNSAYPRLNYSILIMQNRVKD